MCVEKLTSASPKALFGRGGGGIINNCNSGCGGIGGLIDRVLGQVGSIRQSTGQTLRREMGFRNMHMHMHMCMCPRPARPGDENESRILHCEYSASWYSRH